MSNSLGDNAFCKNITATNYQQPFQVFGSLASPLAFSSLTSITFATGFSKYVVYITTNNSTVAIAQNVLLIGLPVDYVGTHTITGSCEWILTGATPTVTFTPVLSSTLTVLNDTLAPNLGSTATLSANSTTAGTYSSGSAIMKFVININAD